uniref:NELL2-interacting cell ontogeny regulator 1 n=1 Tax=Leptobrachium leishanense TaxID=445787 RepID=A0A8C5LWF8_9ANUR
MVNLGITILIFWVTMATSVLAVKTGTDDGVSQALGSVIPAETRPCVDCRAFEFMQRALEDLRRNAYSLDSQTDTLLLKTEQKALCNCFSSTSRD